MCCGFLFTRCVSVRVRRVAWISIRVRPWRHEATWRRRTSGGSRVRSSARNSTMRTPTFRCVWLADCLCVCVCVLVCLCVCLCESSCVFEYECVCLCSVCLCFPLRVFEVCFVPLRPCVLARVCWYWTSCCMLCVRVSATFYVLGVQSQTRQVSVPTTFQSTAQE